MSNLFLISTFYPHDFFSEELVIVVAVEEEDVEEEEEEEAEASIICKLSAISFMSFSMTEAKFFTSPSCFRESFNPEKKQRKKKQ
jgi:hypothetical protein